MLVTQFRSWFHIFYVVARQWLLAYPGKVSEKNFQNFGFRVMSQTVRPNRFLENWSIFRSLDPKFVKFSLCTKSSLLDEFSRNRSHNPIRIGSHKLWLITVIGEQNGQNRQQHLKLVTNILPLQPISSPTSDHEHRCSQDDFFKNSLEIYFNLTVIHRFNLVEIRDLWNTSLTQTK